MDYEKKYNEALERARTEYKNHESFNGFREMLLHIFPELKESEDELTWLKNYISEEAYSLSMDIRDNEDRIKLKKLQKSLAWLDKQGEQHPKFRIGDTIKKKSTGDIVTISVVDLKNREYRLSNTGFIPFKYEHLWELIERNPTDKVEPKFHEGDYVVDIDCGKVLRISEVLSKGYTFKNGDYSSFDSADKEYRLWTIQDAKDGDVLVDCNKDESILMFRGIGNTKWDDVIDYHCYYSCFRKAFCVQKGVEHWGDTNDHKLKPATKEQRDLFFQKMKEAGYEWDIVKKQLITLNHFVDNNDMVEPKFKIEKGKWYVCIKDLFNDYADKGFRKGDIYLSTHDGKLIPSNSNVPTEIVCPDIYFREWTIDDAKDGDIIYAESKFNSFDFIEIFSSLENGNFWGYCDVSSDSDIYSDKLEYWEFDNDKGFVELDRYNFYPATKEQRDLLYKKMKEAGYEWDAENKKLTTL